MSDLFSTGSLTAANNLDIGASVGTANTGDLRRKYNFSDRVSELAVQQDPFFRLVSKVAKKPTDDPHFKFAEKRHSWHKRYAYVTAWNAASFTGGSGGTADDASVTASLINTVGGIIYLKLQTDLLSSGNVSNKFGNGTTQVGASGTQPTFFFEGQLIKVPTIGGDAVTTAADAFNTTDYFVARIDQVVDESNNSVVVKANVVRPITADVNHELSGWGATGSANEPMSTLTASALGAFRIHDQLERARVYVVGNAFSEGSGYPETWKDQPFSTQTGNTQIFKTTCAMTNTARATVLKYEGNEWARIWKDKLIEHKYDIEQAILFGGQSLSAGGNNTTQGAADYILSNGNLFTWSDTKSQDDFLDDMSSYLDPRYNDSSATVYMCSTEVYNWFHKLSGYALANLKADGSTGSNPVRYTGDLAVAGKKNILGLGVLQVNTPYGDMNIIRNIHLDGTHVSIMGINLKNVAYRPLVGNGVNRDTSIYVGVQTLENSGVDRRVDQILTEAGMEFSLAESHAIWTS